MQQLGAYIVPIFVVVTIVYSFAKKNNTYQSFVFGAKTSFDLVLTTFPYIVAIFVAIEVFVVSGLSMELAKILSPVFNVLGIPTQLCELVLIKPFSGAGSLAILENIFSTYGVDSYISRVASVIAGSSEAVFYVGAVYFSGTNVTKLRHGIAVALIANLISAVVAAQICKVL